MNSYQVTRLDFPGLRNPRVDVQPQLIDQIRQRIEGLQLPIGMAVSRKPISCWPNLSDQPLFLYRLLDGGLMYVQGQQVQLINGLRIDRTGDLDRWAREALTTAPATAAAPGKKCFECKPEDLPGEPWRCPCDSEVDLSPWGFSVVVNHNNCYSFARRQRWCGPGQGSQPGDLVVANECDIRNGLAIDGLVPATEGDVLGTSGSFVALFLAGKINYHFLRLDGGWWSHMPSGFAATACDAVGRPIRRDGARQANLPWTFLDYYRVPSDRALDHCQ